MDIRDFYKYSWFSNMAYVEWSTLNTSDQEAMRDAANDARRVPGDPDSTVPTLGQEIFLNQGWTIPSFHENDFFGFAANLFVNENTNEKVLAIRGTEAGLGIPNETFFDLLYADIAEIGMLGLALHQTVSLFNYIQVLKADVTDHTVLQLKLRAGPLGSAPFGVNSVRWKMTEYWFYAETDGQGLGLLESTDKITVTGHSLGGHLSALALRLFPGFIDQAVTFNAAGFDPITSSGLTDEFVDLFSEYLINPPASSFVELAPRLYTMESESSDPGDDTSFVASLFTGTPASPETIIRTENNSHSMDQFMDALGVLSLMETLGPQLSQNEIFHLYDAVSNISGDTEEQLLQSLSKLFVNNDVSLEIVEAGLISHGDFILRSANHARILEIQQFINDNPGATITPLNALATELKLKAEGEPLVLPNPADAIAYRYALVHLNPFVVTGNASLYEPHNQGGELELENFTEEYLTDRAAFLALKIELGRLDTDFKQGRNVIYVDVASENYTLTTSQAGGVGGLPHQRIVFTGSAAGELGMAAGGDQGDHLYGFWGNDILIGGAGGDYLEGGEGDDILYGNDNLNLLEEDSAVDVLVGGDGYDTYYTGLNDIIRDSDGAGEIRIDGDIIPLDNLVLVSGTVDIYTNNDPDDPLRLQRLPNGSLQLIGSYITIEDFEDGDFGIHLDASAPWPALNLSNGTEADDVLSGTTGDDAIHGLGGNDDIDGNGGHDVIFGEAGDDLLLSPEGNDVIDGGSGRDVIRSGAGKDMLRGGDGENFLSAAEGDDYLEGGLDRDYLAGGAGSDTLFGGDGADILWGDATLAPLDRDWTVTVTDDVPAAPGGRHISFSGSIFGGFASADDRGDLLDGGAGDDILLGGGGNDQLYGGDGHDDMEGEAGDDRLEGGAGNDALFGDSSADPTLAGHDILIGGSGDDSMVGGLGNDHIEGGDGNDTILGDLATVTTTGGNDYIDGGTGDDVILAGAGDDIVLGGEGVNGIDGEDGNDTLIGGSAIDNLIGGEGNDVIFGEGGADNIEGSAGNDEIHAGDGNDINIQGNEGMDLLYGDGGGDILMGGDGDDFLHGGTGNDQLTGGAGNDIYRFEAGDGVDTVIELDGSLGDSLQFGAGLNASTIFLNREGNNLAITNSIDANDKLIIQNWFLDPANKLDNLAFDDGATWTQATMESNLNTAPVTAVDSVTANEDISTPIAASTLLANDSDPDGDTLSLIGVSNAVNGSASLDGNGDVVFTSARDFNGTAFFDYTVWDSRNGTTTQTVTVNVAPVNDAPVANPDISYIRLISGGRAVIERPELAISTSAATDAYVPPALTRLANGNIVAVWQGYDPHGTGVDVAYQMFDPSGKPLGPQKQVNIGETDGAGGGVYPSVAALGNGGFVMLWHSTDLNFSVSRDEIIGRQFDANGNAAGGEFRVNTETALFQEFPSVVSLSDGGLFAVWTSYYPGVGDLIVAGQRFDAAGNNTGSEMNLGLPATDLYKSYAIASNHGDGFVVAVESGNFFRYDSAGNLLGSNTFSATPIPYLSGIKNTPIDITALENNNLVIAWIDGDVKARLFDEDGNSLSPTLIVSDNSNNLDSIHVTALESGDFVISWLGSDPVNGNGEYAQRYTSDGIRVGGAIVIATETAPFLESSNLIGMADGGFLSVWTDLNDNPGNGSTLQARVYNAIDSSNGLSFSVDVLGNDADVDADDNPGNFTLDSATLQGTGGQVSVVNNQLLFETSSDFSSLAEGEIMSFAVDYTMADTDGLTSASTVTINIIGGNDAPVAINAIPDQSAFEDQSFSFSLPVNTFEDPDNGDGLVLSARLGDGGDLPAWLAFDPQSQTFSGTPAEHDAGVLEIAVKATDSFGLQTSGAFNLTINNTNDAPVLASEKVLSLAEGNSGAIDATLLSVIDVDNPAAELVYTLTQGPQHGRLELVDNPGVAVTGFTQADIDLGHLVYVHDGSEPDDSGAAVGSALSEFSLASLLTVNGGDGSRGFVIKGIDAGDFTGTVSDIGDINGDGVEDVLIGAPENGNGGPGRGYVVFGRTGGFEPDLELSSLLPANGGDGSAGFVISGINAGDLNGWSVAGAGDVNGDGVADLIIGARRADPNGRTDAGQSYVVFGRADGFAPEFNLASLLPVNGGDGTAGFVINGINAFEYSGTSVAGAGDVNGDGVGDVLIGATNASAFIPSGQSYVIFGRTQGFAPEIELSSLTMAGGGDGSRGFVLNGGEFFERSGFAVAGAGDINGDGFDDILIGTNQLNNFPGAPIEGTAYVIFGNAGGFSPELNLRTLRGVNGGNGSLGFVLHGMDGLDQAGLSVASAGDINGDGLDDLLIGAPGADPNGVSGAGETYVVFGGTNGFGADLNLSALLAANGGDGSAGLVINGIDAGDGSGLSVAPAGDVNGDGVDDLVIGAAYADPGENSNAGESYIVFGRNGVWGPVFDLSALLQDEGGAGFVIKGINPGDASGTSVSGAGDINGDGLDDLIIGAANAHGGAGESYVLFGSRGGGFADDSFSFSVSDGSADNVLPVTGSFLIDVAPINDPPELSAPIPDQQAYRDAMFNFSLDTSTFTDPDQGDHLIYEVKLIDGSGLPAWLSFNTDSLSFSGMPISSDNGIYDIMVTATDSAGATAAGVFRLTVRDPNSPPELAIPLTDQSASEGVIFTYTLPAGSFADPDAGDVLAYSATLGDGGTLPTWLSFDPLTLTFSGIPEFYDYGPSIIRVAATDLDNAATADDFVITVSVPGGIGGTDGADVMEGTTGNNTLLGLEGDDVINGFYGNDRLGGGPGNDLLDGGIGNDDLAGGSGDDSLNGGLGNDVISGNEGDDVLLGEAGNDVLDGGAGNDAITGHYGNDALTGGSGNDILDGGPGNDTLMGSAESGSLSGYGGNDTYVFGPDWGHDRIVDDDGGTGDQIRFGAGISAGDMSVIRSENDLVLRNSGGTGTLTVTNYFGVPDYAIEYIEFADGSLWDQTAIAEMVQNPPAPLTSGSAIGYRIEGYTSLENQLHLMVNAMAIFDPQDAGTLNLPSHEIEVVPAAITSSLGSRPWIHVTDNNTQFV